MHGASQAGLSSPTEKATMLSDSQPKRPGDPSDSKQSHRSHFPTSTFNPTCCGPTREYTHRWRHFNFHSNIHNSSFLHARISKTPLPLRASKSPHLLTPPSFPSHLSYLSITAPHLRELRSFSCGTLAPLQSAPDQSNLIDLGPCSQGANSELHISSDQECRVVGHRLPCTV